MKRYLKKWFRVSMAVLALLALLVVSGCSAGQTNQTAAPNPTDPPANNTQSGGEVVGEADNWPTGPITLLVPSSAGGTTDIFARGIAPYIGEALGVQVIVEDVEGGAGMVGLFDFLNRKDDGSTFMVFHQAKMAMGYAIDGNDYSLDSFAFLSTVQLDYPTLTVSKDSPYQTLEDLIEDVKAHPGERAMSCTPNSGPQLSGYMLMDALGLDVKVVTYDAGNENRLGIAGGHVDFGMSNATGDFSFKDNVRTLAVFSDERYAGLPDAQPINEALEPYGVTVLTGLGAIRNLITHASFAEKYPQRYEKLLAAVKSACENPEYLAYIESLGETDITAFRTPEESYKINKDYEEIVIEYKDLLS